MRNVGKKIRLHCAWLAILLIIVILFASSVGSANLSMLDSLKIILMRIPFLNRLVDGGEYREVYIKIIWQVRLPRIFLAGICGSSLAIVGACFQGLFRNPLADPHILGISSGAAVGATIAMLSGISMTFLGLGVVGIFAFIGALITALIVYQISCVGNKLPVVHILLTGTAVNSMLSSFISLVMSLDREQIEKVYLWTLGSFSASNWKKVLFLFCVAVVSSITIGVYSKELNLISTGEETAESLGVDTVRAKKVLIAVGSLLVAACVSVSGIIGFVGLIIPHCIRLISGPKYQKLIPLSCFLGAIFMILCDTIARILISPSELPVGVITSILGAPYFIFLLQRNKRKMV